MRRGACGAEPRPRHYPAPRHALVAARGRAWAVEAGGGRGRVGGRQRRWRLRRWWWLWGWGRRRRRRRRQELLMSTSVQHGSPPTDPPAKYTGLSTRCVPSASVFSTSYFTIFLSPNALISSPSAPRPRSLKGRRVIDVPSGNSSTTAPGVVWKARASASGGAKASARGHRSVRSKRRRLAAAFGGGHTPGHEGSGRADEMAAGRGRLQARR